MNTLKNNSKLFKTELNMRFLRYLKLTKHLFEIFMTLKMTLSLSNLSHFGRLIEPTCPNTVGH